MFVPEWLCQCRAGIIVRNDFCRWDCARIVFCRIGFCFLLLSFLRSFCFVGGIMSSMCLIHLGAKPDFDQDFKSKIRPELYIEFCFWLGLITSLSICVV